MPSGDEPLDIPNEDEDDSPVIRKLRKEAAEAAELRKERDQLRSENAILGAGLTDLSDRQRRALLATHDGDLEPDALKATAAELGFITVEPEPASSPPGERDAMRRTDQATRNAEPAGGRTDLSAEINAARNPQEIMAILERENMRADEAVRPPRL